MGGGLYSSSRFIIFVFKVLCSFVYTQYENGYIPYIAWQLSYLVTSDWTFINKSQVDLSANICSEFIISYALYDGVVMVDFNSTLINNVVYILCIMYVLQSCVHVLCMFFFCCRFFMCSVCVCVCKLQAMLVFCMFKVTYNSA